MAPKQAVAAKQAVPEQAAPARSAGWRRFLAPYYTSTLLVLPLYAVARRWFEETGGGPYSRVTTTEELWEKVGWGVCVVVVGIGMGPGPACTGVLPQHGLAWGRRRALLPR